MFERFDIYVSGELVDGADPAAVRQALSRMNGMNETKANTLLSGVPVRIKSKVDADTAGTYRASFRKIGMLVEIRPAQTQTAEPAVPAGHSFTGAPPDEANRETVPDPAGISVVEGTALELLPADRGSLEDCVVPKPTKPLPDSSELSLDLSGADLDDAVTPQSIEIDTSHLSVEPPNVGSLEDCVVAKPVKPIPDVSHLRLLD